MPRLGRMKGNAFREFLLWIEREQGSGPLRAAYERLSPEHQALLDPERPGLGVLASSWYPVEIVHQLLDQLTDGLSEAETHALARRAATVTIGAMMRGVQKMAFSLLVAPRRYPKIINRLWRMNYDSGSVRVVEHGDRCHEGIISGWRGHHPLVCLINQLAKEPMYRAMGCKDVRVEQTACISKGDADCRSKVTWR